MSLLNHPLVQSLPVSSICKITEKLFYFPYVDALWGYFDLFFSAFETIQSVNSYFIHQLKLACLETLEEFAQEKSHAFEARLHKNPKTGNFNVMFLAEQKDLRTGDIVSLTRLNLKSNEPIPTIRGVVIDTDKGVEIELSFAPRDVLQATWNLSFVGNIITVSRSIKAIELLATRDNKDEIVQVLLGNSTRKNTVPNELQISERLNKSQNVAILCALEQTFSLWQGPVGTGKTTTIGSFILHLLNQNPQLPILVSGTTNAAVDNIAKLLISDSPSVSLVRIGSKKVVAPELHKYTLKGDDVFDRSPRHRKSKDFQTKLKSAQIICATCTGCGSAYLEGKTFNCIIVDEAAQVSESNCLIPLSLVSDKFLLVGDHKQLQPFSMPKASQAGYSRSLFERLYNPEQDCLLNIQYRMHPALSKFPNQYFYDSKLLDGVSCENRPIIAGYSWPNGNIPLSFIQVNGIEQSINGSKRNSEEAKVIRTVLEKILLTETLTASDVGIISFYSAQLRLLNDMLRASSVQSLQDVEVNTVDGFQGREKQLIIISCVRCNDLNQIGFLDAPHRFNVALTRAKRGLIVVGNQRTLASNSLWNNWFATNQLVVGFEHSN